MNKKRSTKSTLEIQRAGYGGVKKTRKFGTRRMKLKNTSTTMSGATAYCQGARLKSRGIPHRRVLGKVQRGKHKGEYVWRIYVGKKPRGRR